jgi:hypothetical protein
MVVWSVAEGRPGRRWREVRRSSDGALLTSLLLETDPEGAFAHTELSSAAGLLTLHPEGRGTLHGNVVTEHRLRHVAGLAWTPGSIVLVHGSVLAAAAATRILAGVVRPGASHDVTGVSISVELDVEPIRVTVRRTAETDWQLGSAPVLHVDDDGLPVLADARTWPLEAE